VNTRLSPAGVFDPIHGPYVVEGNRGHSTFNGVYFTGKVRMQKTLLIATYTWSKTENLANDFNTLPGDVTNANWELDLGPSPNDVRHRLTGAGVFDLVVASSLDRLPGQHRPADQPPGRPGRHQRFGAATDPATGQQFGRNSFRAGPEEICPGARPLQAGRHGRIAFPELDVRLSKTFKFDKDKGLEVLFESSPDQPRQLPDREPGGYTNRYPSRTSAGTSIVPNSQRRRSSGVRFHF